jgi:hypothetical protein
MKIAASFTNPKILQCGAIVLILILLSLPLTLSGSPFFLGDQNIRILPSKTSETSIKSPLQTSQDDSYRSVYATVPPINSVTNNPPNPPLIEGPTTGETRTIYFFNITVTDPDEDPLVLLEVDFGDGSDVFQDCGCGGTWSSGKVLMVEHQWKKKGTFALKARVQDGYGLWSDWGTLDISLSKSILHQPWDILSSPHFLFTYIIFYTLKLFAPIH